MAALAQVHIEWKATPAIHADPALAIELKRPIDDIGPHIAEPRARRILFDTSALYAPHHRILIHRFASRENPAFTPLWSEWILAELYYSLAWSWAATARSIDPARGAMAGPCLAWD